MYCPIRMVLSHTPTSLFMTAGITTTLRMRSCLLQAHRTPTSIRMAKSRPRTRTIAIKNNTITKIDLPGERWLERLSVLVATQSRARIGQDQLSQFHAPRREHLVRHLPDLLARALHDDNFQAIVVVKVHVRGGQH